jgi:hypothetical protein
VKLSNQVLWTSLHGDEASSGSGLLKKLWDTVIAAARYVALDLSACDMTDAAASYDFGVAQNISSTSQVVSVILPEGLTKLNGMFRHFASLTSVKLPSTLTTIGDYAFYYCYALTSLELPDNVTTIGKYVFQGSGLSSLELPDSLTTIDENGFNGCSLFTSIDLPAGLTTLGKYAFSACSLLTSIDIPAGVTALEAGTIRQCPLLVSITLRSPTLVEISNMNQFTTINANYKVYVPSNLVNEYKAHTYWSEIADHIYPIQ